MPRNQHSPLSDSLKPQEYLVYHDESEPKPNKGWLLIGLLFVRADHQEEVAQHLARIRREHGYNGEIHFCELPASFNGEFGAKARVARDWLRVYQNGLCEKAMFCCLALNRSSPGFQRKRFAKDFHVYNRFTAIAIKSAVKWFLKDVAQAAITLISDGKTRKSGPTYEMVDNFENYIAYRVELDSLIARDSYPELIVRGVRTVSSAQHDLLQLTDILLGAIQCALVGKAKRLTKRDLALRVLAWCKDIEKEPWKQTYKMHRKFSVWGFPDENGEIIRSLPWALSLDEQTGQRSLFDR